MALTATNNTPRNPGHDYEEDFEYENGDSMNKCSGCGAIFMGGVNRYLCKKCDPLIKESIRRDEK
jgi:hypothetical protein